MGWICLLSSWKKIVDIKVRYSTCYSKSMKIVSLSNLKRGLSEDIMSI